MLDPSLSKACSGALEQDGRCRTPVENHHARLRSERLRSNNEILQALGAFRSARTKWLSRCCHIVTSTWCLVSIEHGWHAGGAAPASSRTRCARLSGICKQDASILRCTSLKSVRPCVGRFFVWRGPGPHELGGRSHSHSSSILMSWRSTRRRDGSGPTRPKAPPPCRGVAMGASGKP
jgi:hypothetical protein